MRITVYYQNGMIDEFDTMSFTNSEPFKGSGKNIITEFQLRLDLLKTDGLLLDVNWYDCTLSDQTPKSFNEQANAEMYHAMRQLGRRIVIATPEELQDIAKVTRDNELLIWQQGGELIDAVKFANQEILCFSSATTESINRKATIIYDYLAKANPGSTPAEIAEMMGYTADAFAQVQLWEVNNIDSDDSDDEAIREAVEYMDRKDALNAQENDEPESETSECYSLDDEPDFADEYIGFDDIPDNVS